MARRRGRNSNEYGIEKEEFLINDDRRSFVHTICAFFDFKDVLVFISDWIWFVSVISSLLYDSIGIVLAYVVLNDATNYGHPVHSFAGNFMIRPKPSLSSKFKKHENFIRTAAVFSYAAYHLLGFPVCLEVMETKNMLGFRAAPSIGNLIMNLIGMKYGDIINNLTIFYVNLIAAFMNTLYVLTFNKYAQDQWTEIFMPMGYAIAVVCISFVYAQAEDPSKIKSRFGLLMVTLYTMYMGMPLLQLPQAIFAKDVTFISYPMNLMGFLMSFFWLLYAVVLEDQYLTAANLVGLLITGIHLLVSVSLGIADAKLRSH